ncbi:MAG: EcoKI restriction-modification system protein HsdS [Clostridia bacterium]|jgi:type I restriction enzyme S subunit|nr:EcoKI restriction-modification system protein HsdS [Clostridia bacterium]
MSWKEVTIGSFLRERPDRIEPNQANFLGLKRIEKIDFSGNIYLADNTSTRTNMILVKPGDLVISGINVAKGALAVYEGKEDVLATIHYSSYEFDKSVIDIEYLKWFLISNKFMNILKEQVGGGIKTELKPKKFLSLKIKLPDINLQKEIAKKINNVYDEIELLKVTNEENYELISKLRQSILQEAVQGKLVPQDPNDEPASVLLGKIKEEKERLIKEGKIKKEKPLPPISEDEIPYEIPEGWEWAYINDIAFVTKLAGFEYTKYLSTAISTKGDVPIIRAQNIKMNKFIENTEEFISYGLSKKLNRSAVYKKCLLMTFIGAGIGEVAIFNKNTRFHLAPNVAKIEIFNNYSFNIDEKYILYYLMSTIGQNDIFRFQKATAQPSLSMETIRKVRTPIPPLNEQKRIVEKVDQLMALCDELEKNIEQSKKDCELLIQSVLQEAFKEA